MKLSTVFELLLIFLIIAFAASKFIEANGSAKWKSLEKPSKGALKNRQASASTSPATNRYCSCSNLTCHCCKEFSLPVVPVSGPGCATLKYVQGNSMLVTMSFGDRILKNVTISGKKPKPICMNLPGGISKFCGRLYEISRDGEHIRACLGLELKTEDDVEAALRVSCFKLGPKGLNVEPGKPVPTDEDEDDEDDDDDDFGLSGAEDDDDDDDDDDNEDEDDDDVFSLGDDDENESDNTVESSEADYTGFSALGDEFLDSFFDSDLSNKKKKQQSVESPITNKPASVITVSTRKVKPARVTQLVMPSPVKSNVDKAVSLKPMSLLNETNVFQPSNKVYSTSKGTHSSVSPANTVYTVPNKVFVSPSQYKPTERLRLTSTKNSPETYIPITPQILTEKVYSTSQQISTDRPIYSSTLDINNNNRRTNENNLQGTEGIQRPIIYYTQHTQQLLHEPTEKLYTTEFNDSSLFSTPTLTVLNLNQSIQDLRLNNSNEVEYGIQSTENSVLEGTIDSQYNEIDSDLKTTIIKDKYTSEFDVKIPTTSSLTSIFNADQITTQSSYFTEHDGNEVYNTVTTNLLFEKTDSKKNNDNISSTNNFYFTERIGKFNDSTQESNSDEETTNTNNDSFEFVSNESTESQLDSSDEDDDNENDKFQKFHSNDSVSGFDLLTSSSSNPRPTISDISARTHKRMNLPPLFSQKPEIFSFWSSGGHLYKIRMAPLIQDSSSVFNNPSRRLGKLNLFVPTNNSTFDIAPTHRFDIHPSSTQHNHYTPQNNRQHKRMRISLSQSTPPISTLPSN